MRPNHGTRDHFPSPTPYHHIQYKNKNTAKEVQTSDPIKKSLGKPKITGEAKTWTVNEMLASETIATANIHTA